MGKHTQELTNFTQFVTLPFNPLLSPVPFSFERKAAGEKVLWTCNKKA